MREPGTGIKIPPIIPVASLATIQVAGALALYVAVAVEVRTVADAAAVAVAKHRRSDWTPQERRI